MEVYNSEQEQVDAIKAWWDKNGRTAMMALVAFLVAVLGWQGWEEQRKQRAEAASSQYQQVLALMLAEPARAQELGRALVAEYPGSSYAQMTSLALARLAVEQGDLDGAAAQLRAILEQDADSALASMARLRLARIELEQGKSEQALATLGETKVASALVLRGDIYLVQGKRVEARTAYAEALRSDSLVSEQRDVVKMKHDDLTAEGVQ